MGKTANSLEFHCLCFDTEGQCAFGDETANFALILKGNISLFSKSSKVVDSASNSCINDDENGVSVTISKLPGVPTVDYTCVFYLKCEKTSLGEDYIFFDQFRFNLIRYLVEQKFGKIYLTQDDLSASLLDKLYLKINRVENLLRSYIVKHFAITQGVSSWFTQVLDNDTRNKVNKRKANEDTFTKIAEEEFLIDTRIYLTDFEDIGNIIYANSYGNYTAGDLIDRIKASEDLNELKTNIQKNIERYFATFKEVDFQEKWEFLRIVRHKVAHNGLLSLADYEKANTFLSELIDFLEARDDEKVVIQPQEDEYIDIEKRQFLYTGPHLSFYEEITREELLREISSYQRWSNSIGREFMGLKNFLHNRLGGKGFHIGKAWDKLEELEKEGFIEIYTWQDPKNIYPDQKAIKVKRDLPIYGL